MHQQLRPDLLQMELQLHRINTLVFVHCLAHVLRVHFIFYSIFPSQPKAEETKTTFTQQRTSSYLHEYSCLKLYMPSFPALQCSMFSASFYEIDVAFPSAITNGNRVTLVLISQSGGYSCRTAEILKTCSATFIIWISSKREATHWYLNLDTQGSISLSRIQI